MTEQAIHCKNLFEALNMSARYFVILGCIVWKSCADVVKTFEIGQCETKGFWIDSKVHLQRLPYIYKGLPNTGCVYKFYAFKFACNRSFCSCRKVFHA